MVRVSLLQDWEEGLRAGLESLGDLSEYGLFINGEYVVAVKNDVWITFAFPKPVNPANVVNFLKKSGILSRCKFYEYGRFLPPVGIDCTNSYGTLEKLIEHLKMLISFLGGRNVKVIFVKYWEKGTIEANVLTPAHFFRLYAECKGFPNLETAEATLRKTVENTPELKSVKTLFIDSR